MTTTARAMVGTQPYGKRRGVGGAWTGEAPPRPQPGPAVGVGCPHPAFHRSRHTQRKGGALGGSRSPQSRATPCPWTGQQDIGPLWAISPQQPAGLPCKPQDGAPSLRATLLGQRRIRPQQAPLARQPQSCPALPPSSPRGWSSGRNPPHSAHTRQSVGTPSSRVIRRSALKTFV